MQGTVVMLMALSGLGCHNKYDVAYGPPTYSAFFGMGCYANVYPNYMATAYVPPSCYAPCYADMYNGCYSACYGGGYGGGYVRKHHGCCFLSRLFGCCGCGKSGYGDPYAGYGYMGYGGPEPMMGGPGPMMGGPGPMMGGPGPYMGGPGFGGPYEPAIFGYALQFNYGDPTVDAVPVPTIAPPPSSSTGAPSPAPPSPNATPVPPARDTGTPPPPPPPTPANIPGANPPRPPST
jgi:hypothetical protein